MLAEFHRAKHLLAEGDTAGAVGAFDKISANEAFPREFRNVATVYSAMNSLETVEPDALMNKLEPMLVEGHAFRETALELVGLAAGRKGDKEKAAEMFQQILSNEALASAKKTGIETYVSIFSLGDLMTPADEEG